MANHQGDTLTRAVAQRLHEAVATVSALAAIPAEERLDGMLCQVAADGSMWRFVAASTAADSTAQLVVTPGEGSGRWHRADKVADLSLAIGSGTVDAAVLFTVPAGFRLLVLRPYWEITTAFEGGSSSAIGLSSSATGHTTKGDLLGGASGDVEATLTVGVKEGTIGADIAAGVLLQASNTIKFDRITSAFTSGAGYAHVPVVLLAA